MDGIPSPSAEGVDGDAVLRTACVEYDAPDLIDRLEEGLGQGPFALVLIFSSPAADFERLEYLRGLRHLGTETIRDPGSLIEPDGAPADPAALDLTREDVDG